jgi:hypothetical protein
MGKCAQCGNNYDQSFEVTMGGRTLVFDSFECAIAALAPVCPGIAGAYRRPRRAAWRHDLLLRPLRQA